MSNGRNPSVLVTGEGTSSSVTTEDGTSASSFIKSGTLADPARFRLGASGTAPAASLRFKLAAKTFSDTCIFLSDAIRSFT